MKLTELEIKLLLKIPLTFDILLAKMQVENIGSDNRRIEIREYAEKLRFELGV